MEHSHVPLHKWLIALRIVTTSRGYLSPQKLKLQLGLGSYRTAWLMTQRIRDALWRHRRELERQGSRRGLISSLPHTPPLSPGGLASPTRAYFDDALNALLACPPKPPERARIEQKRPFQPRSIAAFAVAETQAFAGSAPMTSVPTPFALGSGSGSGFQNAPASHLGK